MTRITTLHDLLLSMDQAGEAAVRDIQTFGRVVINGTRRVEIVQIEPNEHFDSASYTYVIDGHLIADQYAVSYAINYAILLAVALAYPSDLDIAKQTPTFAREAGHILNTIPA